MESLLKLLFSPIVFSVGFATPLIWQVLIAFNVPLDETQTLILAAIVSLSMGACAQWRGSWIWIKR